MEFSMIKRIIKALFRPIIKPFFLRTKLIVREEISSAVENHDNNIITTLENNVINIYAAMESNTHNINVALENNTNRICSVLEGLHLNANSSAIEDEKFVDFINNTACGYKEPVLPGISQLFVQLINYCNSRCKLCNHWQNKTNRLILPLTDFESHIRSPLFKNIDLLEMSGGEITIIKNFIDYVDTALRYLPSMKMMALTFNCLAVKRTIEYIAKTNELCAQNGVKLLVNISLNGFGKDHDVCRGMPGNFEKVEQVLNFLDSYNSDNLILNIGSRITKSNIFNMDKFFWFLKERKIKSANIAPGRNAKYFGGNLDEELEFDNDETYQLDLLFHKFRDYFKGNAVFYDRCISGLENDIDDNTDCLHMLGKRIGIFVDSTWSYCVDLLIKNDINNYFCDEYQKNRNQINEIKNHCCKCFHFPCIQPNEKYYLKKENDDFWSQIFTINGYKHNKNFILNKLARIDSVNEKYTILITGWYGTETTGDKAILGGIIDEYKEQYKDIKIKISSLYPFVTERTIYELGIEAEVVPVYSSDFFMTAAAADETIIGGGPLMELEVLSVLMWAFYFAKKNDRITKVYGCGVGPLFTEERKDAVKTILSLADEILLRDENSKLLAEDMSGKKCMNIGDPAVEYIKKTARKFNVVKDEKKLSLFLRDLTYHEYFKNLTWDEFVLLKNQYEQGLADNIKYLCAKEGVTPHFYAMSNFIIGSDDRDFNYYFTDKYLSDIDFFVDNKLSTVESVTEQMLSSEYVVCMRYHSAVFANTLNTKFVAVDYTNGGKVLGYFKDHVADTLPLTLEQVTNQLDALQTAFLKVKNS